jgi:hypothetical protein
LTVDYRIPITNTTIFNGPITNNTLFNGTRDTSVIQALAISPVPISSYFHTVSLMNLTEKHETAKITKFTGYSISEVAMIANKEPEQLVKESIGGKIETWGKFAATIIPVALSILSLIFPKFILQK